MSPCAADSGVDSKALSPSGPSSLKCSLVAIQTLPTGQCLTKSHQWRYRKGKPGVVVATCDTEMHHLNICLLPILRHQKFTFLFKTCSFRIYHSKGTGKFFIYRSPILKDAAISIIQ